MCSMTNIFIIQEVNLYYLKFWRISKQHKKIGSKKSAADLSCFSYLIWLIQHYLTKTKAEESKILPLSFGFS